MSLASWLGNVDYKVLFFGLIYTYAVYWLGGARARAVSEQMLDMAVQARADDEKESDEDRDHHG